MKYVKSIHIPATVKLETKNTSDGVPTVVRVPDGDGPLGFGPVSAPSEADINAVLSWCAAHSYVPHYEAETGGFSMGCI